MWQNRLAIDGVTFGLSIVRRTMHNVGSMSGYRAGRRRPFRSIVIELAFVLALAVAFYVALRLGLVNAFAEWFGHMLANTMTG